MKLVSAGIVGTGWSANAEEAAGAKELIMKEIPSSGEKLPVIGMGTWQTFDVGASAEERAPLKEVLMAFQQEGGRVLDSSPMYGKSEQVAGDLMRETGLREKLFVATKVWTRGKAEGVTQMEDSMSKLGVKAVDLMQVHNLVDVAEHLKTLREWKEAGRVRYVGITHYHASGYEPVAKLLESEKLDFLQINYSLGEREAEKQLLPLAKDKGVAVIINRPFAGGDLFSKLRAKPLPEWAGEIGCTTWAQLMLKFVISHPAVTCAIPATSKVSHLRDNMGAGRGKMPDEELRKRIAGAVA